MAYKILTSMDDQYRDESQTRSARQDDMQFQFDNRGASILYTLQTQLQDAIAALENLRAPLPPLPPNAGLVAKIKAQHEATARNGQIAEMQNQIAQLKHDVMRHGGRADDAGNVTRIRGEGVVVYDATAEQQGLTRVTIKAGLLYTSLDLLLSTSNMSSDSGVAGHAMFVMSAQGHIHITGQKVGERHHSSLLAAANVAAAGEIKVDRGQILFLSNKSGHYLPDLDHFLQILHQLRKAPNNVSLAGCTIRCYPAAREANAAPREYSEFHPPYSERDLLAAYGLNEQSYDLNNLLYAYKHLLTAEVLASKDWEWRLNPPSVYRRGTNQMIPHREVRHFLKHHEAAQPKGQAVIQATPDPLPPKLPLVR